MNKQHKLNAVGLAPAIMIAAALGTSDTARAQDESAEQDKLLELTGPRYAAEEETAPEPIDSNTGAIGISGGTDFVSTYWFRGIAQENEGLIVQPYLTLSFEISEDATLYVGTWNSIHKNDPDGLYESGDLGQYLELGVAPSFPLIDSRDYPVTLSVPVTVGLDVNDYYENAAGEDSTFGFADVGLVASTPLAFMPSRYGQWTLTAGIHGIYLGDAAQEISATDFNVVSNEGFHVWGGLGISFVY